MPLIARIQDARPSFVLDENENENDTNLKDNLI